MSSEVVGPYAALDHVFQIESDSAPVTELLRRVFAPLTAPDRAARSRYVVTATGTPGFLDVHLDDRRIAHVDSVPVAAEHLIWTVNRRAVDSWSGALLHGGAAETADGRGVVVVGRSGAGKSTMIAALVQAGFGYLSDELIPIDAGGSIRGHPRAIALKPGSWDLTGTADVVQVGRTGGVGQRHLDPAALGAHVVTATTASLIIVLDRVPESGAPLAVDPMTPAAAVEELCHHAFNLARLGVADLESIRNVAINARTVTLRGGTPTERVAATRTLLDPPIPPI